jgi:predicted permease
MQELRLALRALWKRPGFSLVVIATFALAVGVNTAIFSVVNAVLLKPLPYRHPEQLVGVFTQYHSYLQDRSSFSAPEFQELVRDSRSYESLAGYAFGTATFGDIDRPVRVAAAYTTWEFLSTLGVSPALGRYFDPAEDLPGDPRVVVLGHELWKRAFGGDPGVVGRSVLLDGYRLTVVGVMPEGFDFPRHDVEAWLPFGLDRTDLSKARGSHGVRVIGRLRKGTSLATAQAELATLTRQQGALYSDTWHTVDPVEHPMVAFSLHSELVGAARAPLWILQAAVLLILLIACANIGNLLLGRAESRTRELAIRAALGAGWSKVARLFLGETLLLGLIGGALGVVVAVVALRLVIPFLPAGAPRSSEIGVDAWALAFAIVCTLVTSVAVGLVPLMNTRMKDLHARLAEGGLTATGRSRLRKVLVAGEVAAALVLVLGCGVMLKSFARLSQVDLGFRPEGLLSFELELPAPRYPTSETRQAFWERLQAELSALPGVTGVTLTSQLPTATEPPTNVVTFEGSPPYTDKGAPVADTHIVGHHYFETLGMRLVRGRLLRSDDRLALVINESAARKFFPGKEAVGQLMRVTPWVKDSPAETVVGVVADAKHRGVDLAPGDAVYIPLQGEPQMLFPATQLRLLVVVRTAHRPEAMAKTVEDAVRRIDSSLPLSLVRTMDRVVWEAVAKPRFISLLMSVFAVLALTLSAIGVYGVMSYTVEQRTREIGVRVALGAQAGSVQSMVLRQTLTVALWGAGAGLLGALLGAFVLRATLAQVLFETAAADPVVMLLVAALILGVAALASWFPARRASRVDPMIALRAE